MKVIRDLKGSTDSTSLSSVGKALQSLKVISKTLQSVIKQDIHSQRKGL